MEKSKIIYLDYASATPIEKGVLAVLDNAFAKNYANTSALHELGIKNKNLLDNARKEVARIIGAHSDEIIFTSGATEANNLIIQGMAKDDSVLHIITTNIEHASVLETCKTLSLGGRLEITYVPVEKNGIVDSKKIKKAIKENTVLVSVMYANNEIGTIQPIKEIAKEIRHYRKENPNQKIIFHIDAAQAINYLPIQVEKLGIDAMSFNAAKIYGPKGIGALYLKRKNKINPVMLGGGQEFGMRAGTENLPLVLAFARALEITERIKNKEIKRLTKLRDYFIDKLINSKILMDYRITLNGDVNIRLPNNINISIPKIPSDLILIELSARGIYISEKSACKSMDKNDSHVIRAISNPKICKKTTSLRFSLGRQTTKNDIDYTIKSLSEILKKLKKWYT